MNITVYINKFSWKPSRFSFKTNDEILAAHSGCSRFWEMSWLWFSMEICVPNKPIHPTAEKRGE